MQDTKIFNLDQQPTGEEFILSTTDESFKNGRAGEYIRMKFPERCKYET